MKLQDLDNTHPLNIPDHSPHQTMPEINIGCKGVGLHKLLEYLNPHISVGPDQIKPIIFKTLNPQFLAVLSIIFICVFGAIIFLFLY